MLPERGTPSRRIGYERRVAARVPRRPEIPGIPGFRLPGLRPAEELRAFEFPEEDEPTNPYPYQDQPRSGTVLRAKSLSVGGLSQGEAAQLAGIIAAWEGADDTGRHLLAEFAKRLGGGRRK
jgi:hypothetical protein